MINIKNIFYIMLFNDLHFLSTSVSFNMLNFYSVGIFELVSIDFASLYDSSQKLTIQNVSINRKTTSIVKLLKLKHSISNIDMVINPQWTIDIIVNYNDDEIDIAQTYLIWGSNQNNK